LAEGPRKPVGLYDEINVNPRIVHPTQAPDNGAFRIAPAFGPVDDLTNHYVAGFGAVKSLLGNEDILGESPILRGNETVVPTPVKGTNNPLIGAVQDADYFTLQAVTAAAALSLLGQQANNYPVAVHGRVYITGGDVHILNLWPLRQEKGKSLVVSLELPNNQVHLLRDPITLGTSLYCQSFLLKVVKEAHKGLPVIFIFSHTELHRQISGGQRPVGLLP